MPFRYASTSSDKPYTKGSSVTKAIEEPISLSIKQFQLKQEQPRSKWASLQIGKTFFYVHITAIIFY